MSAVLDVDAVREWTVERLDQFLGQATDVDLDWRRFEIVDGVLVVSPPSVPFHETLVQRLGRLLGPVVPDGYEVTSAIRINIGRSYRVTDLTVVTAQAAESDDRVAAGEVLIAVEIESPSSITTDRITKPAQYAMAGIPHYWRLETDPIRLHAYRLVDSVYAPVGSWTGNEIAAVRDPFDADLDLGTLVRRSPPDVPERDRPR